MARVMIYIPDEDEPLLDELKRRLPGSLSAWFREQVAAELERLRNAGRGHGRRRDMSQRDPMTTYLPGYLYHKGKALMKVERIERVAGKT